MRPNGRIRTVVVFGHGWKQYPPSQAHPYPGQFRPWLAHLAAEGCAVIFPRYQDGGDGEQGSAQVRAFRRGLELGFTRLHHPRVSVVAVGYSYGASLAFYYAANARRWHLAAPSAVDAIFPAGLIAGAPLPQLANQTQVLIQVGDRDAEAGSGGANSFWSWLKHHPPTRKRYETIRSTGTFLATHAAAKETTAEARRAFWQPLDALIDQARRKA